MVMLDRSNTSIIAGTATRNLARHLIERAIVVFFMKYRIDDQIIQRQSNEFRWSMEREKSLNSFHLLNENIQSFVPLRSIKN
jgi:hypothetical protein